MLNCKVCDKEFEPNSSAHKICSDGCREKQQSDSRKAWRTKTPHHRKVWAGYSYSWRARNIVRARLTLVRTRAKSLGLPFELSEEDVIIPKICPVLGIPIDSTREGRWTFDKIIPSLGYTKANTRIISSRANRLKNDASLEELEKIIQYIKNNT